MAVANLCHQDLVPIRFHYPHTFSRIILLPKSEFQQSSMYVSSYRSQTPEPFRRAIRNFPALATIYANREYPSGWITVIETGCCVMPTLRAFQRTSKRDTLSRTSTMITGELPATKVSVAQSCQLRRTTNGRERNRLFMHLG